MEALIMDGSAGDATLSAAQEMVERQLKKLGYAVFTLSLEEKDMGDCRGCFGCWVKTPGKCVIQDDAPEAMALLVRADVLVLISPVTFGGYSYHLKKLLDRSICISLPFFTKVQGETHHPLRYEKEWRLVGIGGLKGRDEEMQNTFRELVRRNSINLQAEGQATAFVFSQEGRDLTEISVKEALAEAGVSS